MGHKQLITIKGTRSGLTLFIDDLCAFEDAIEELRNILLTSQLKASEPIVSVTVETGNRYLYDAQKLEIEEVIGNNNGLQIQEFKSNVMLRDEALKWREESEVKVIRRIIRSGQKLEVEGDLLLVGDINPGGLVISTGNIYIMGNLHGIAHAGANGDVEAIIAASYMKPSQLRIANYISRSPDYETVGVYMEYGFFDEQEDKIVIDNINTISKIRKNLNGFERRMQNE